MLKPDIQEAQRFFDLIAPDEAITFQTIDDFKPPRKGMAHVLHGSLNEHSAELTRLNQAGAGVFFMVNQGDGIVHDNETTCRKAKNVIRIRANFVDLDGAPLQPLLDAAIPPQIVVETSPGKYHAYWRVADCPLDKFKPTQKVLISRFNGDESVHDLPRILRVPGFWHQKATVDCPAKPFMSRLVMPERRG